MIRRLVSAAVVVGACITVLVLAGAGGGSSEGRTIKIAFDNAFGVAQGGDVRVAGVKAGQASDFSISRGPECQLGQPQTNPPRTCAIITVQIQRPGFQSFRTDASCAIRQQSLIGEYYIDCQPGSAPQQLPKKTIIADTRTSSTIPADLVGDVLRQPYRERLRLIIGELGTGLAGRPHDLGLLLHNAAPALQQTDRVLSILANQHQIIQNFITDSNTVVTQLDQNKADVARWIKEAGTTAAISATRASDIAAGIQRFPRFLDELRPTMQRLGELTDAQTPLLHELQGAAPSLNQFLKELGPFSQANIPNFQTLGQAAVVGIRAFHDSQRDINELNLLAQDAPGTAKPLRQWLQSLDSRKRSPEPDSRAAALAPPAPDPNTFHSGQGFTGMEGLLNYVFNQTLAINNFDSISHVLSSSNNVDPTCSPFLVNSNLTGSANAATRARCNAYLGPYQPGITSPDVTNRGAAPGFGDGPTGSGPNGTAASAGTPQRGQLAATTPLPGQTDYSQPNPTLAPSTQALLASLNQQAGQAISTASVAAPSSTSVPTDPSTMAAALDYLLAP